MSDDDLRDRLAKAIRKGGPSEDIRPSYRTADVVLAEMRPEVERLAEYENAINWYTDCLNCSRLLDSAVAADERAGKAEQELQAAIRGIGRLANERGAALEWLRVALQDWDGQPRREWDDVTALVDAVRAAVKRGALNQPSGEGEQRG